MLAPASCPACLRVLPPGEDDGLALELGGRDLVDAVRELRGEGDDEELLDALDLLTEGLCPACGQAVTVVRASR